MRILPKNTTVYAWINGKLERAYAEYIPAQGYHLEGWAFSRARRSFSPKRMPSKPK